MHEEQEVLANVYRIALELLNGKNNCLPRHSRRVSELSASLARLIGLDAREIIKIKRGALFHDIGKIAIDNNLLNKPASLNSNEVAIMQNHPLLGVEVVKGIIKDKTILEIIKYHHESWDGKGYPAGLAGNQIPLGVRIVTITDAFDAMTSFRSYKDSIFSPEEAVEMLWVKSGVQFDRELVEAFTRLDHIEVKGSVAEVI